MFISLVTLSPRRQNLVLTTIAKFYVPGVSQEIALVRPGQLDSDRPVLLPENRGFLLILFHIKQFHQPTVKTYFRLYLETNRFYFPKNKKIKLRS